MNRDLIYLVCDYISKKCPKSEHETCTEYDDCLDCWRSELKKELLNKSLTNREKLMMSDISKLNHLILKIINDTNDENLQHDYINKYNELNIYNFESNPPFEILEITRKQE